MGDHRRVSGAARETVGLFLTTGGALCDRRLTVPVTPRPGPRVKFWLPVTPDYRKPDRRAAPPSTSDPATPLSGALVPPAPPDGKITRTSPLHLVQLCMSFSGTSTRGPALRDARRRAGHAPTEAK